MSTGRTVRERVRLEMSREIVEIARRQLATHGPTGLSLRAVAREMGMVSSAVHRYFPTRDDLLSALIIDGYDALGAAIETAEAACPRSEHARRWLGIARAVRSWALAHPHEYALIHGSPVPGYRAPQETVRAAARGVAVFGRLLGDAHGAGTPAPPDLGPPPPPASPADLDRARQALGVDVDDEVLGRALTAWTALFGHVSFELFGQFENLIDERAVFFDHSMTRLGLFLGLH